MAKIGQYFTAGSWLVKPGKESEFIAAWDSFAKWTAPLKQGRELVAYFKTRRIQGAFCLLGPGKTLSQLIGGDRRLSFRHSWEKHADSVTIFSR